MAKKKEFLIVASKVKAYIKSKKMMTSSDALVVINDAVYSMLDAAVARTKANRRRTVKPHDVDAESNLMYMRRYCGANLQLPKTCSAPKKSHAETEHALVSRRQANKNNIDSQYADEDFVDLVATHLEGDIDYLISFGIKLDEGALVAKTGGVALYWPKMTNFKTLQKLHSRIRRSIRAFRKSMSKNINYILCGLCDLCGK